MKIRRQLGYCSAIITLVISCVSGVCAESRDDHGGQEHLDAAFAQKHGGAPEGSIPEDSTPEGAEPRNNQRNASSVVKVKRRDLSDTDPRGPIDLTICSQNLKLYGTFSETKKRNSLYSEAAHDLKTQALVERFMVARCDVIAVQELMGRGKAGAEASLNELASILREKTNRIFSVVVAPPVGGDMTSGYLVAKDRASIQQTFPYARVELPKINEKARPRIFSRMPFEIQLVVKAREGGLSKVVTLVNFHFKSKRGGRDDPSGLEWETYRMEMAEALRRIVEQRHRDAFGSGESLLVLLGDRNSNYDVASARILEGGIDLSFFAHNGVCRLSKRGVPLCKKHQRRSQKLFSVVTGDQMLKRYPGTFSYKGQYSWLDDILVPQETLPTAWKTAVSEGSFNSGVIYTPVEASDHALIYVSLNW